MFKDPKEQVWLIGFCGVLDRWVLKDTLGDLANKPLLGAAGVVLLKDINLLSNFIQCFENLFLGARFLRGDGYLFLSSLFRDDIIAHFCYRQLSVLRDVVEVHLG